MSALVEGIQSASKVTTVAVSFALPTLAGYGLDRWWGTLPAATITGALIGFVLGLLQSLNLAREAAGKKRRGRR
jgi:hypothetical protein